MKLGILVSDFRNMDDTVSRLTADKLGVIFVSNGVYHAAVKENGKASPLLDKTPNLYVLSEDLRTKGFSEALIDSRVKSITYSDLVDLIFSEYEKVIWV
ncbi:MAG TPA: DsrH/TusB family sulfur metabolism protein [Thermodesulfovibrionales bacterium]|jgi:sulfur relay protein TusB/DsrH|nr:DsrH/TusB family sulfur metabolism protein [Thermodesulfovibrionales bacterium]